MLTKYLLSAGYFGLAGSLFFQNTHIHLGEKSETKLPKNNSGRNQARDVLWPGEHGEEVLSKSSQRKYVWAMWVRLSGKHTKEPEA